MIMDVFVFLISFNTKNKPINSAIVPVIVWKKITKPVRVTEIRGTRLETRENPIHIKDKPPKRTEALDVLSCFKKFFLFAYRQPKRRIRKPAVWAIKVISANKFASVPSRPIKFPFLVNTSDGGLFK